MTSCVAYAAYHREGEGLLTPALKTDEKAMTDDACAGQIVYVYVGRKR